MLSSASFKRKLAYFEAKCQKSEKGPPYFSLRKRQENGTQTDLTVPPILPPRPSKAKGKSNFHRSEAFLNIVKSYYEEDDIGSNTTDNNEEKDEDAIVTGFLCDVELQTTEYSDLLNYYNIPRKYLGEDLDVRTKLTRKLCRGLEAESSYQSESAEDPLQKEEFTVLSDDLESISDENCSQWNRHTFDENDNSFEKVEVPPIPLPRLSKAKERSNFQKSELKVNRNNDEKESLNRVKVKEKDDVGSDITDNNNKEKDENFIVKRFLCDVELQTTDYSDLLNFDNISRRYPGKGLDVETRILCRVLKAESSNQSKSSGQSSDVAKPEDVEDPLQKEEFTVLSDDLESISDENCVQWNRRTFDENDRSFEKVEVSPIFSPRPVKAEEKSDKSEIKVVIRKNSTKKSLNRQERLLRGRSLYEDDDIVDSIKSVSDAEIFAATNLRLKYLQQSSVIDNDQVKKEESEEDFVTRSFLRGVELKPTEYSDPPANPEDENQNKSKKYLHENDDIVNSLKRASDVRYLDATNLRLKYLQQASVIYNNEEKEEEDEEVSIMKRLLRGVDLKSTEYSDPSNNSEDKSQNKSSKLHEDETDNGRTNLIKKLFRGIKAESLNQIDSSGQSSKVVERENVEDLLEKEEVKVNDDSRSISNENCFDKNEEKSSESQKNPNQDKINKPPRPVMPKSKDPIDEIDYRREQILDTIRTITLNYELYQGIKLILLGDLNRVSTMPKKQKKTREKIEKQTDLLKAAIGILDEEYHRVVTF